MSNEGIRYWDMAGKPKHPSGPKQTICIALTPHHLHRLDQLVTQHHTKDPDTNRSRTIAWLLDRAPLPGDPPRTKEQP